MEARVAYERKCQKAAEVETIFKGTIKNLEQTEALEEHVKTVTMRAKALATTEAEVFKTLIERQEEAQKNLNELPVRLSQQSTATRATH